jgi:hypothetical protein
LNSLTVAMSVVLVVCAGQRTTVPRLSRPSNEPVLPLNGRPPWAANYRSQPPGVSGAALARLIAGVGENSNILQAITWDHGI